ncbi:MAG TPA: ATP-dependent DNA helicase RecG [Actinomycetota bacterium]|jgi:ATP-dependent DNA helicase RecG|nr:ATP-dependent DNA helicase RecG [Actinomycetota bacterium]
MALTLGSPIRAIDARLAGRRMGWKAKGPPASEVLADSLGIRTVGELLEHYPRRYIDRSQVTRIGDLRVGQQATVIAKVKEVKTGRTQRTHTDMATLKLYDGSGYLSLVFFNQRWIPSRYRVGHELAVTGVVQRYRGTLQLGSQEVEVLRGDEQDLVHMARITPIHPAAEHISTRTIRELIYRALEQLRAIPDPLPRSIAEAESLPELDGAVRRIHFPESQEELEGARERLKFDELFFLELGVAFRKHRLEAAEEGVAHRPDPELVRRLLATLPFEPTGAQRRAMHRVGEAMARPRPMNLLLQGDVGAGKTLVAVHAALVAVGSRHQAAIMAPTEVLAAQHLRSLMELLQPLGAVPYPPAAGRPPPPAVAGRSGHAGQLSLLEGPDGSGAGRAEPHDLPGAGQRSTTGPALTYALLTAAVTGKERARILDGIANGEVDLVVGTHALVQEAVTFHDLSLAVIDEQHRFGVHQRMALKGKGGSPDILIMTATPIPRTLALTYYGDLDVVVLDEMPRGRRPVQTRIARTASERAQAYALVRREVERGRQAFVVCAAIDEANKREVRAAEAEAERLASQVFPDLSVELLHGRMRPAQKERVMEEFRAGTHHLLISTTVIEVGVDVPNATVMLVENAERFGLAQLHQLRGRIGRAGYDSFCILFDESGGANEEARSRLEAMVRTTDGFELADEDLRLRGEGTLFDIRQSGMPDLRLARLAEDLDLVQRARARAFAVIGDDPRLEGHPELVQELRSRFHRSIDWLFHS